MTKIIFPIVQMIDEKMMNFLRKNHIPFSASNSIYYRQKMNSEICQNVSHYSAEAWEHLTKAFEYFGNRNVSYSNFYTLYLFIFYHI